MQTGSSGRGFADVLGTALTQGIDAVKQIKLAQFQVSPSVPNTSGPDGSPALAGQGAYNIIPGGISPMVALGGLALLGVLVWKLARK